MSLADLSIRRPIFITCTVLVTLAVGFYCMNLVGVDLFPDVTLPVVTVTTPYPGAGPSEIESLISKPIEDEISTVSGIKRLSSLNYEGVSRVVAEFTLGTDVKYAEQQVRDRVTAAKPKLPQGTKEPIIRRIDPADQPILTLSLNVEKPEDQDNKMLPEAFSKSSREKVESFSSAKLYDLANEVIRARLSQVNEVGLVEIVGGRKREIHVILDQKKLKDKELSASTVAARLGTLGNAIPVGKIDSKENETVFRSLGEFESLKDISHAVVNFYGSEVATTISQIGEVKDTLEDENTRAYLSGKKALFIRVFRQSGANTIAVVERVKNRVQDLNREMSSQPGKASLTIVRDGSLWIKNNVEDVKESILMGVGLAIVVVFFFLGNVRSTVITGLALPNSLIGAFILIAAAGFTINIMTLLALSLSVGLLIDDAIVVRENIFRQMENGMSAKEAARVGTDEVRMAVIATTLAVIAVFGPVGFLKGVTGQFFKQFGLTICFAMMISLFDALTIAPMLSAYFAGLGSKVKSKNVFKMGLDKVLHAFDRFQNVLEQIYVETLKYTLKRPIFVLFLSGIVFALCASTVVFVPKTFLPTQDGGEFTVSIEMPPGTNISATDQIAQEMSNVISKNREVALAALTVGGHLGEVDVAEFYVKLVPFRQRKLNTSEVKEKVRNQLASFSIANPKVKDYDFIGGGMRQFNLNLIGNDVDQLNDFGEKVSKALRENKDLKDVDTNFKGGKPEYQIRTDLNKAKAYGVNTTGVGQELRAQVEGVVVGKFREKGVEYDVRVRVEPDQRDIKKRFENIYIPNMNHQLIRLADFASGAEKVGPATVYRQDRGRLYSISADIAPGAGLGNVMLQVEDWFKTSLKMPPGIRFAFVGQAEDFKELVQSMGLAMGFGILFIFLILASLYESFITPLTIMLALPLALCGSFVALAVTQQSLNIFSMIGTIMLLGIATKNSILLVDYANQLIDQGNDRDAAMLKAGQVRLRPILMTSMALIAGTLPVALGLNEASRQRTSMGIAIIGGLISSTILTLVVVPAAFTFIDRFKVWVRAKMLNVMNPPV